MLSFIRQTLRGVARSGALTTFRLPHSPSPMHSRSILTALLCLTSGVFAQEWTRFRGPNGTGISTATTIPVKWTEKDFNWKVQLPGVGHSSPVLWGDKIFVTAGTKAIAGTKEGGAERFVLCLNKEDGKEVWRKKLPLPTKSTRRRARKSPTWSWPTGTRTSR